MKAKSFFVIWIFPIIFIQTNVLSQYGWFQQASGTTQTLNSISVVNDTTVFVCGSGGIVLKTINGGVNWSRLTTNYSYDLTDIFFFNIYTGWACGGVSNYPGIGLFSVLKTSNGGVNWFVVLNSYSLPGSYISSFNSVYFINYLTGFVGVTTTTGFVSGGYLIYTSNGGTNWQQINPSKSNTCLTFIDPSTGYLLSHYADDMQHDTSYFYRSTDSGINWNMLSKYPRYRFKDCKFINDNTGWIAGTRYQGITFYGTVFKSTNGGINWLENTVTGSDEMNSVSFNSSDTGYVCGLGIYRSTNGGLGWSMQQTQVLSYMNKIKMINSKTGWCVGSQGLILKTNTAGIDAVNIISEQIPDKFSLLQNYPNPFNPITKIRFSIPKSSQQVQVIVYGILGNKISELVNEKLVAGTYETVWDASNYSSGVYYYRLIVGDNSISGGYIETKKMILIK
jgi:photosystem II stability/assembly factor-like uncharacterized protein